MQKWITHMLLIVFVGFLSTPTAFAVVDKEVESFMAVEEEEENIGSKNSEVGEEKIVAVLWRVVHFVFSAELLFHLHTTTHTLSDDMAVRTPSPPPETIF